MFVFSEDSYLFFRGCLYLHYGERRGVDPMKSLFRHFSVYKASAHRVRYMKAFFDIFVHRIIRHLCTLLDISFQTLKGLLVRPKEIATPPIGVGRTHDK